MDKSASAVGFIGIGALLIWSGVTNAGVLSTAQTLLTGHAPMPGQPQASIFGGKNVTGSQASLQFGNGNSGVGANSSISGDALRYAGAPYSWGGSAPPESFGGPTGRQQGWDCYGFLTWVLHHDLGYNLPNNTYTGYLEFLSWGQQHMIPASEVQAGDIVIWPTHCGIAVSSTEMISAENPSAGTVVNTFSGGGPLVPEPMTFHRITGSSLVA